MAPTFLPGGSLRLSATGGLLLLLVFFPMIKEGCALIGTIASPILPYLCRTLELRQHANWWRECWKDWLSGPKADIRRRSLTVHL